MRSSSQRLNAKAPITAGGSYWDSVFRWQLIWAVAVGVVAATAWSFFLSFLAGLPRIGPVPLPAAIERINTPTTWLVTSIVSTCVVFFVQALVYVLVRLCRPRPEIGNR